MRNLDEIAIYLARRIRQEHVAGRHATREELLEAAGARGVMVFESREMARLGYFIPRPVPVIGIRRSAPVMVLAHELGHFVLEDNVALECDYDLPLVVYPYPDGEPEEGPDAALERACHLFAAILCEDEPDRFLPSVWQEYD